MHNLTSVCDVTMLSINDKICRLEWLMTTRLDDAASTHRLLWVARIQNVNALQILIVDGLQKFVLILCPCRWDTWSFWQFRPCAFPCDSFLGRLALPLFQRWCCPFILAGNCLPNWWDVSMVNVASDWRAFFLFDYFFAVKLSISRNGGIGWGMLNAAQCCSAAWLCFLDLPRFEHTGRFDVDFIVETRPRWCLHFFVSDYGSRIKTNIK